MTDDANRDESPQPAEGLDDVLAELMAAIDRDDAAAIAKVLEQHPQFAVELNAHLANEKRVKNLVDPLRAAAARVLHVRCPHCRNQIELLDDTPLTELSCPSCGSSFSLVGDKSITHYAPGEKTIGHFQLLDRVGIGAFGSVWKARDTQLDRVVAVKIPRSSQMNSDQTELFLRDARAAAQLKHPNIVSVHEVGKEDDSVYIVSDFVEGATLQQWGVAKPLNLRETAQLCLTIAEALHHAHESGVVHRDLKPGNIMMDGKGQPHIVDFGLAKREAGEITMTMEGQILGTPAYMSPEQARGEGHAMDRRGDIYSLGVILFELLTGELPFRGDKQMLMLQILNDEPPSPRKLNSNVPRDLETICLRCLEKEPQRRFQSAAELAEDLQRWLMREPILSRPMQPWERGVKWARRRPAETTVIAFAAAIALILPALLMSWHYNGRLTASNDQLGQALDDVTKAEARARAYHYSSQMQLVQRAIEDERPDRAVDLLRTLIPTEDEVDLRDFEWHHLWRKYHGEEIRIDAHEDAATAVDWSPDGRWIATASNDSTIRIWDAKSRAMVRELRGHDGAVTDVKFSPDGGRLVSSGVDQTVRVWNSRNGNEIRTLEGHEDPVRSIAISADGNRIAGAAPDSLPYSPRQVLTWDAHTGERIDDMNVRGSNQIAIAFHPEDGSLAVALERKLLKWRPGEEGEDSTVSSKGSLASANVEFSRDGRLLLGSHGIARASRSGKVVIWDVAAKDDESIPLGVGVTAVAFSPDGETFAAAGRDQSIRVWNTESKELKCMFHASDLIHSIAFSPDGEQLAAGVENSDLMIWDVPKAIQDLRAPDADAPTSVAFGKGGETVGAICSGNAVIWNVRSGEELLTSPGNDIYRRIALSQKTALLAGLIPNEIHDAATGQELVELEWPDYQHNRRRSTYGSAFSEDARFLAAATQFTDVRIWRTETGELKHQFKIPGGWATSVAFGKQDKWIAAGSGGLKTHWKSSGALRVWEVDSGSTVFQQSFSEGVWDVRFSPDGSLLAAAMGAYEDQGMNIGRIRVWETSTWKLVHDLRGHAGCIWSVAFHPNGQRLASASGWNRPLVRRRRKPPSWAPLGEIKIWDLSTGRELLSFQNEGDGAFGVAFSPDGNLLATANHSGSVKLLDGTPVR